VIHDEDPEKSQYFRYKANGSQRAFTHKALNARIQGSAADIMKVAMVDVWESGVCDVLGPPQLTVHDELDGSAPRTRAAKEALREIKRIMEGVVQLAVPLRADGGTGPNWGAVE
jgi:DNA polymerase-1